MNKNILACTIGVFSVGCLEVYEEEPYYDFAGLEFSQRQDFNLPDAVQYFEVRLVDLDGDPFGITPETIFQFDPVGYQNLDLGTQIDLDMLKSTEGFASGCAPSCPVYIAAVGDGVSVVDSFDELKRFLGPLDTPPEFAIWLMQWNFELLQFRANSNDTYSFVVTDGYDYYDVLMNPNGELLHQGLR